MDIVTQGDYSSVKMWRWVVLWQALLVLVVGTFDFGFFTQKWQYPPTTPMNCFEYSKFSHDKIRRVYNEERRYSRGFEQNLFAGFSLPIRMKTGRTLSRRIDMLGSTKNDILKEHGKLVQDINSLKQFAYVVPIKDDTRDYDESIFHEIIETSPIPKVKKTLTKPSKTNSFPIILAGGASNYHEIKSEPVQFLKPIVNLVGTTASPVKHPYPFVQATSIRPIRICMPSLYSTYATSTERPSLWESLLKAIIPT